MADPLDKKTDEFLGAGVRTRSPEFFTPRGFARASTTTQRYQQALDDFSFAQQLARGRRQLVTDTLATRKAEAELADIDAINELEDLKRELETGRVRGQVQDQPVVDEIRRKGQQVTLKGLDQTLENFENRDQTQDQIRSTNLFDPDFEEKLTPLLDSDDEHVRRTAERQFARRQSGVAVLDAIIGPMVEGGVKDARVNNLETRLREAISENDHVRVRRIAGMAQDEAVLRGVRDQAVQQGLDPEQVETVILDNFSAANERYDIASIRRTLNISAVNSKVASELAGARAQQLKTAIIDLDKQMLSMPQSVTKILKGIQNNQNLPGLKVAELQEKAITEGLIQPAIDAADKTNNPTLVKLTQLEPDEIYSLARELDEDGFATSLLSEGAETGTSEVEGEGSVSPIAADLLRLNSSSSRSTSPRARAGDKHLRTLYRRINFIAEYAQRRTSLRAGLLGKQVGNTPNQTDLGGDFIDGSLNKADADDAATE